MSDVFLMYGITIVVFVMFTAILFVLGSEQEEIIKGSKFQRKKNK
ncbi:MAG: hypothetical protein ACRD97_04020 [Nitrososphaeraceae archaeon]